MMGDFRVHYNELTGQVPDEFWNNIYHQRTDPYAEEYEPYRWINGWLIRFFTVNDDIQEQTDIKICEIDVPFILSS